MFKFSLKNLQKSHETPWLILDLVMMGLLILNLIWLVFDSLFSTDFFKAGLDFISPVLVPAYQPLHDNFLLIDLSFVAIFLTEFCFRWAVSVYRKEYMRWYFFPFIHWYDLIGCIPASSARIFRFLRIFSILYRLHKYRIINLKNTALVRFITFYYNVFVEELSDRIVVKVLSDAQKDIAAGSPLIDDITDKVLSSRRTVLSEWLAAMLVHAGDSIAHHEHGEVIRTHVKDSVGKAVRDNPQISTLSLVPVLGGTIERTLETSVTDIVTHSVINLLKDITPAKIEEFAEHGIHKFSAQEKALDKEVLIIVNECLDLVKEHVSRKRWKEALDERDQEKSEPA